MTTNITAYASRTKRRPK